MVSSRRNTPLPGKPTHHQLPPACPCVRSSGYALHSCPATGAQPADARHREGGGGDGRVQQYKQALLATAGSLPPRLSDASSHSVLQQFVKKTATSITGSTFSGSSRDASRADVRMPLGASTCCITAAPPDEAARVPVHEAAASARRAYAAQGRGSDPSGTREQVRTPGPSTCTRGEFHTRTHARTSADVSSKGCRPGGCTKRVICGGEQPPVARRRVLGRKISFSRNTNLSTSISRPVSGEVHRGAHIETTQTRQPYSLSSATTHAGARPICWPGASPT